jgi:predicted XRE-type DNA-binding protein
MYEVSNSEKLLKDYNALLQIVKQRFIPQDAKVLNLNKSKVSRVLNGQFDIFTLSEMASICGLDVELNFVNRK